MSSCIYKWLTVGSSCLSNDDLVVDAPHTGEGSGCIYEWLAVWPVLSFPPTTSPWRIPVSDQARLRPSRGSGVIHSQLPVWLIADWQWLWPWLWPRPWLWPWRDTELPSRLMIPVSSIWYDTLFGISLVESRKGEICNWGAVGHIIFSSDFYLFYWSPPS